MEAGRAAVKVVETVAGMVAETVGVATAAATVAGCPSRTTRSWTRWRPTATRSTSSEGAKRHGMLATNEMSEGGGDSE